MSLFLKMRGVIFLAGVASVLGAASASSAALASSIGNSGIDCSLLAPAYCLADLGCTLQGDVCRADPSIKPELNCTKMQSGSSGAVQDVESAMIDALKGLKDLSKTVGSSTAEAIEKFVDVQKEWDSCMEGYNKSLLFYSNQAAVLDSLQSQLIELEQNCTSTSAPPGCGKLVEDMELQVLEQNATSAKAWIVCTLMQQKLLLAESKIRTGNDEIAKTTTLAQKAYADAATMISDSTKAKQDALNFWNVIKDACIHAAPVFDIPTPSNQSAYTSFTHQTHHSSSIADTSSDIAASPSFPPTSVNPPLSSLSSSSSPYSSSSSRRRLSLTRLRRKIRNMSSNVK